MLYGQRAGNILADPYQRQARLQADLLHREQVDDDFVFAQPMGMSWSKLRRIRRR